MRQNYFTTYSTLEEAVLQNVGFIHSSGKVTATDVRLRRICQSAINNAIHYINALDSYSLRNVLSQSAANLTSGIYTLDLINDCGLEYVNHIDSIYLYDNSEERYKSPLKYVTSRIYLASFLPIIKESSGRPVSWSIFEKRYLYFYPKSDATYNLFIVTDNICPNFENFTGVSPFPNNYDYSIIAIATGIVLLAAEDTVLAQSWISVANSILTKQILNISVPGNFKPRHQASVSSSKTWTDPSVNED